MITSSQNPKLKLVRALQGRPKERRRENAFVAEGVRLVEEALACAWPIRLALYSDGLGERGQALVAALRASGADVEEVAASLLQAVSGTETPQGLLAVLDYSPLPVPRELDFVLIPDRIRDPGNLGALLRTAAAAGAGAVFLPPETADAFAPKVLRAGMGAHFRLPILPLGWDTIRSRVDGLYVYLAEMKGGLSCWEADFRPPLALIVGGEAAGASQPARDLSDASVHIPMPGGTESLNAAVAGAVLMFEVLRQRSRPAG
ncbi:MAG: RNA methyltransferase [Chloroflexi bacterium]|nr:RNA methyltransferase [Chloroflexota bacterium]